MIERGRNLDERFAITDSQRRRSIFREVNECIRQINASLGVTTDVYSVLCECDDTECVQRFDVPAGVYDSVRADADRYLVIAGHERPGSERTIVSADGYSVVAPASESAFSVGPAPLPAA